MQTASVSQVQSGRDAYTDLGSVQAIHSIKDKNLALQKIAEQFESMMLRMMMKSMRSANEVFAEGNYLSSHECDTYRDMLDDQLALTLSQGRGMGIADVMVRQLQGRYGESASTARNEATTLSDYQRRPHHSGGPLPTIAATAPAAVDAMTGDILRFDGTKQDFVDKLYPLAEKAGAALGVKPEVLLAQSALETGWGRKVSPRADGGSSFNFFNIKADGRWRGDAVSVPTLEYRDGVAVREKAAFRAYPSADHSFDDYVSFVGSSARYEKARACVDGESFIRELAEAGYATDDKYADKVISIMNDAELKAAVSNAARQSATDN